jgi:hypothetical protein
MTKDNDLVKRLRKRQEFEFIDGYKRIEWEDNDALEAADRIEELEAKLAKAVEALEGCMIGGNHLVTWLPENHLPADTDPLAALVRHGAGVSHDIWCCWRSIMQARATLAKLKGDKP